MGKKIQDYKAGPEFFYISRSTSKAFMETNLADFIKKVFTQRTLSFEYNGEKHEFTFYQADINNRYSAEYFIEKVKSAVADQSSSAAESFVLLMKFYMRMQDSEELDIKIPGRIIRRGNRKFDVRTLATSGFENEGSSKFIGHLSFAQVEYPGGVLDAEKRYNYLVGNMNLTHTSEEDIFEKAIYIRETENLSRTDEEYQTYTESFYQKLIEWDNIESLKLDELPEEHKILSKDQIKELHREFINFFRSEFELPAFKKLFLELEGFYFWIWESIFISVFESIKSELSLTEKRAFLRAYLRQEYIDYCIPLFEPLLTQFLRRLTKEEKSELYYLLLIDIDNADLKSKYDKKFTDFIKFYPLWVDIIRLDENMSDEDLAAVINTDIISRYRKTGKSMGGNIVNEFVSLFDSTKGGESDQTYQDIIGEEDKNSFDSEHLEEIIRTKLSEKEREVIEMIYFDTSTDHTQQTIAEKLEISQSAVNQRLKSAIKKLKPTL